MTKNRNRKIRVRAAAASTGTNYTTALRTQTAAGDGRDTGNPFRLTVGHVVAPRPAPFTNDATPSAPEHTPGRIDLGITSDGGVAQWDPNGATHMLIAGASGSGKSVVQRTLIEHALAHPDDWEIAAIDLKMIELGWLCDQPNVLAVGTHLAEADEIIRAVQATMWDRYAAMEQARVGHHRDLPGTSHTRSLLLAIDEADELFDPDRWVASADDPANAGTSTRARMEEILRLGRAAGIHVVIGSQSASHRGISRTMRANCAARLAVGRMSSVASQMALGNDEATRLPRTHGQAILRQGDITQNFQAYHPDRGPI